MVYHLLEPFIHGLIYIQFIVEYNENNPNGLYVDVSIIMKEQVKWIMLDVIKWQFSCKKETLWYLYQIFFQAMGLLMASLMWLVKNVYIQSLLGIECEQYYIVVKDSKVACLKFFNSGRCSGKMTGRLLKSDICWKNLKFQEKSIHFLRSYFL